MGAARIGLIMVVEVSCSGPDACVAIDDLIVVVAV